MRCLVTGGGGFFGSELTRQLVNSNYKVRVLLRRKESVLNLNGVEAEIIVGDIRDKSLLNKIFNGIDYVFHTASIYDTTPFHVKYPKDVYEINVEGTRNVCEACLEAKVKKLIYTGSTAAVGLRDDKKPADESVRLNVLNKRSHYEKTKAIAQEIALSSQTFGLWVVSVNPSFLIGAGDIRPTPTGEVIVKFLNRQYPCYFDATMCLSDVKSAARAHIDALEKGSNGQSYIVGYDQFFTIQDLFCMLEKASGVSRPKLKLPLSALLVFSIINETLIGIFGLREKVRPLIAFELVRYLTLGCKYDSSKASRELGFKSNPIEEVIKESVDWYIRNGYVKNI